MSVYTQYVMKPANAFTADLIRAVPTFVALRLSWAHNTPKSLGMEKFIEEHLPKIRSNNPDVKYYLHRSYTDFDPFVVGEYKWNRHRKKRVDFKHELQILGMVEEMMAHTGDYREGLRRRVQQRLPRGQEIWDTETMGHDVFEVHSKWKADAEDLKRQKTKEHPHFVYRKYPK
ncbi:unnamed protein product, partial [Mesorhabditis spiculigera]